MVNLMSIMDFVNVIMGFLMKIYQIRWRFFPTKIILFSDSIQTDFRRSAIIKTFAESSEIIGTMRENPVISGNQAVLVFPASFLQSPAGDFFSREFMQRMYFKGHKNMVNLISIMDFVIVIMGFLVKIHQIRWRFFSTKIFFFSNSIKTAFKRSAIIKNFAEPSQISGTIR